MYVSSLGIGALPCNSKVSKGAKIRNRYNQVQDLTQDTNGKMTNSQLDTTNENKEVSPFPAKSTTLPFNNRNSYNSVIIIIFKYSFKILL